MDDRGGLGVIVQAEPEFAGRVRHLFDAGRHKTIATVRRRRVAAGVGHRVRVHRRRAPFGSMPAPAKGPTSARDARFALHGPTFHPAEGEESEWPGEAKIAGGASRRSGPPRRHDDQSDGEAFVADVTEVVVTGLNAEATKLVVEWWTPETDSTRRAGLGTRDPSGMPGERAILLAIAGGVAPQADDLPPARTASHRRPWPARRPIDPSSAGSRCSLSGGGRRRRRPAPSRGRRRSPSPRW